MDSYERNLEKGGRVVGNMIGWGLRRLWDSLRNASEERKVKQRYKDLATRVVSYPSGKWKCVRGR